MNRARLRFLRLWIIASLLLLAAAAGVNYVVDPYGLVAHPGRYAFNARKPRPERTLDDIKLAVALRQKPDVLILGNSRGEVGIDPRSPALLVAASKPYNLSVPGSGLPTSVRLLETLLQSGVKPQRIIVGVEFFDYLNDKPAVSPLTRETAREVDMRLLKLRLQSLFTFGALTDSIATLKLQSDGAPALIRDDGFNPLFDYGPTARQEGYWALFRQRNLDSAKKLRGAAWPADIKATSNYLALEKLLLIAEQQDIPVDIVTWPYHAEFLALIRAYGLLPAFEDWKRTLAATVNAHTNSAPVRFWDFAMVCAPTSEAVPAPADKVADTQWYWEGGHFKAAMGERMLAQILGGKDKTECGRRLAPGWQQPVDLEAQLAHLLMERPDLAADLAQVTAAVPPNANK